MLVGRSFTWSNERNRPTLEKIDRWFCSSDGLQPLATTISDYCPLLMSTAANFRFKRQFHFETFWTKLEGFQEVVAVAWQCNDDSLNPMARSLQSWGQKKVGNIRLQTRLAREVILRLAAAHQSRDLTLQELWLRRELKKKISRVGIVGTNNSKAAFEIFVAKEGDANTRFFHLQGCKRRRNFIARLRHENITVNTREEKEPMVFDYVGGGPTLPRADNNIGQSIPNEV